MFAVRTRKDVALCACKTQNRRQKFGFPNMTPLPLHDSRPPYDFCLFLRRLPLTALFAKPKQQAPTTSAMLQQAARTSNCHSNTFPFALILPPQLSPSHAAILPPLLCRRTINFANYKQPPPPSVAIIHRAYSATSQSFRPSYWSKVSHIYYCRSSFCRRRNGDDDAGRSTLPL